MPDCPAIRPQCSARRYRHLVSTPESGLLYPPPSRGIPMWVIYLVWGIILAAAVVVAAFLVLASAFACDSGWRGCDTVGLWSFGTYAAITLVVGAVPVGIAAFGRAGTGFNRAMRIVALVLVVISPGIGVLASFLTYAIGYDIYTS